jgi:hypothetical protein
MKNDVFFETLIKIQSKIVKRWEALRRNTGYQDGRLAAYEAFLSRIISEGTEPNNPDIKSLFYTSPEGLQFAHNYKLILPFDPEDDLGFNEWGVSKEYIISLGIFTDARPIDVIPQLAVHFSVQDHGPTRDTGFLRDNRFLFLAIDLQKPKQEIRKEFERYLEAYFTEANPKKDTKHGKKGRGNAIDFYLETDVGKVSIYNIWNMNKKQGKSPSVIVRELFSYLKGLSSEKCKNSRCKNEYGGQDCGKNDCFEFRARLKNVNDAIKTAHREISLFTI